MRVVVGVAVLSERVESRLVSLHELTSTTLYVGEGKSRGPGIEG